MILDHMTKRYVAIMRGSVRSCGGSNTNPRVADVEGHVVLLPHSIQGCTVKQDDIIIAPVMASCFVVY